MLTLMTSSLLASIQKKISSTLFQSLKDAKILITFLGHFVTAQEIVPLPDEVEAIQQFS